MKVISKGNITVEFTTAELALLTALVSKHTDLEACEWGFGPNSITDLWNQMYVFYQEPEK